MKKLHWNLPDVPPVVKAGTEKLYWIATQRNGDKPSVSLAMYQNRPYTEGDENDDADALVTVDGEFMSSIGWVENKSHVDFDNFYEPLSFSNGFKLLSWAEYVAPEFNPEEIDPAAFFGVHAWEAKKQPELPEYIMIHCQSSSIGNGVVRVKPLRFSRWYPDFTGIVITLDEVNRAWGSAIKGTSMTFAGGKDWRYCTPDELAEKEQLTLLDK